MSTIDAAGAGGHQISLLRDAEVHLALRDTEFQAQWQTLFDACPHATFFQSVAFASAWYGAYGDVWRPVVAVQRDSRGVLSGLWPLAHDPRRKLLVHVGAHQAEYHLWLARSGEDVQFICGAWKALTEQLEFAHLRLRYLPERTLFEALQRARAPGMGVLARRHPRPLEPLDPGVIRASQLKKSNRSRLNRLNCNGTLHFRRLRSAEQFDAVLDTLIEQYDTRQQDLRRGKPFAMDPHKRAFYRALLINAPHDTYLTVSFLDNAPVAAFVGLCSGTTVHLALLMHAARFARHSPGKLHLLNLAEYLIADGRQVLDLTPGTDPWKARFAQTYDDVMDVELHRSAWPLWRARMAGFLVDHVKRGARIGGFAPSQAAPRRLHRPA